MWVFLQKVVKINPSFRRILGDLFETLNTKKYHPTGEIPPNLVTLSPSGCNHLLDRNRK
jgi:hypothetical protein